MTDVLVIGAGAAGLCVAHFLCERGLSVTVVERSAIGAPTAASSGNSGFVAHGGVPLGGPGAWSRGLRSTLRPDGHLAVPFLPDRAARRWLRLSRRAPDTTAALVALKGLSLRLVDALGEPVTRAGLIVAYRGRRGFAAAAARAGARVLSPAELADLEPGVEFDIAGALYQDNAAFLRAPDLLTALAADLAARGVDIRTGTEVTGFETDGDKVTAVRTTAGEFRPTETVIAAGTWSPSVARMLGLDLPVYPVKGYAVTVDRPPGAPRGPVLLHEGTVAVRPLGDRVRLAGSLALTGSAGVSRRRLAAVLATVRAHLPAMAIPAERHVWTGYRPCTPDSLPLLGRPAALANVTLACGHGHVGMGLAPGAGLLVADLVTGSPPSLDPGPYRPDRFAVGRPTRSRATAGGPTTTRSRA